MVSHLLTVVLTLGTGTTSVTTLDGFKNDGACARTGKSLTNVQVKGHENNAVKLGLTGVHAKAVATYTCKQIRR